MTLLKKYLNGDPYSTEVAAVIESLEGIWILYSHLNFVGFFITVSTQNMHFKFEPEIS